MEQQPKSKPSRPIIIGAIVLIVVVGGLIYYILSQRDQIDEMRQENEITKQQLEDGYDDLAIQYEGFKINIKNDSLLQQLSNEQAKVQRLREELNQVKAEDKETIDHLNKELMSLRKIMRSYIAQIDSLNRLNQQLTSERDAIKSQYQQTARTLDQVKQEKEGLSEKVTLASKLDATNISIVGANKNGKAQKKIDKIEQLIVNFTITKNITAQPGEREIFVRVMKPDNDALTKSRTNTFPYENSNINYSMKRLVEYGGEETGVTLYWNVEEYLMPGTYRVDIFADGNRIGSRSFSLEK